MRPFQQNVQIVADGVVVDGVAVDDDAIVAIADVVVVAVVAVESVVDEVVESVVEVVVDDVVLTVVAWVVVVVESVAVVVAAAAVAVAADVVVVVVVFAAAAAAVVAVAAAVAFAVAVVVVLAEAECPDNHFHSNHQLLSLCLGHLCSHLPFGTLLTHRLSNSHTAHSLWRVSRHPAAEEDCVSWMIRKPWLEVLVFHAKMDLTRAAWQTDWCHRPIEETIVRDPAEQAMALVTLVADHRW